MGEPMAVGNDTGCGPAQPWRQARGSLGQLVALRLSPGADVYTVLRDVAEQEGISDGVILSGVGSLRQITLRNVRLFPDKFPIQDRHRIYVTKTEPLELLTLTGNISQRDGAVHVHAHAVISSGLEAGAAYGGHLVEGCIVLSTVEIVIAAIHGMAMIREMDPQTRVIELCFAREDHLPAAVESDLQE
jgi:predicted DNA-binding protein with PD1-like motif